MSDAKSSRETAAFKVSFYWRPSRATPTDIQSMSLSIGPRCGERYHHCSCAINLCGIKRAAETIRLRGGPGCGLKKQKPEFDLRWVSGLFSQRRFRKSGFWWLWGGGFGADLTQGKTCTDTPVGESHLERRVASRLWGGGFEASAEHILERADG